MPRAILFLALLFQSITVGHTSYVLHAQRGDSPVSFGDHPRLLLNRAILSTLVARKNANTHEYAAMKTFVDSRTPPQTAFTTTLASPLGTGGAGTIFTVADGSQFPTAGDFQIRIDLEIMTATRSGNTFTVVSRGNPWQDVTAVINHPVGANVWHHLTAGTDVASVGPAIALLVQLGVPGYETIARWNLNAYMAFYSPPSIYTGDNAIRWHGFHIALMYDWTYHLLSPREREIYSDLLRLSAQDHIDFPKMGDESADVPRSLVEAVAGNNIANGQLRSVLAMAAATHGDNPSALRQWSAAMAKINSYVRPAMLGGAIHDGPVVEGSEYAQTTFMQILDIFQVIATATNQPDVVASIAPWAARMVRFYLYASSPGATSDQSVVTVNGRAGSNTVELSSSNGYSVGQEIGFSLDYGAGTLNVDSTAGSDVIPTNWAVTQADVGRHLTLNVAGLVGRYRIEAADSGKWRLHKRPAAPGTSGIRWNFELSHTTTITQVSGNTLTLRDPLPNSATGQKLSHRSTLAAFGDVEQSPNYNDYHLFSGGGEPYIAVANAQNFLAAAGNEQMRAQAEHWLDTVAPVPYEALRWRTFMVKDPNIAPSDYTKELPLNYSTSNPAAMGIMFGRSSWSPDGSWITLIAGHHVFDHATSYFGSYGYKRKGVYLTRHLVGYGATGIDTPVWFNEAPRSSLAESPYVGARYHNSVQLNGHSLLNVFYDNSRATTPSTLSRSHVSADYLYGRVDASGLARWRWTSVGWPNNDAQTFVRDFLYINPDLIVFQDVVEYVAPTLSPTKWFIQTPGDPSVSTSQRLTMSHAGQKLVQDIVLPERARFSEVDHRNENIYISGYRTEVVSGSTASEEYGLHVLQGMDDADSPAPVTTLTKTSANVVQVGSTHVIGFVRGSDLTQPISYRYVGSPTHYLVGFRPGAAYHVANVNGTMTISSATGSGDVSSNSGGMLIIGSTGRVPSPAVRRDTDSPPAPSGLRVVQ